jgi:hypothetical protein
MNKGDDTTLSGKMNNGFALQNRNPLHVSSGSKRESVPFRLMSGFSGSGHSRF